jgi:hypothetical protein
VGSIKPREADGDERYGETVREMRDGWWADERMCEDVDKMAGWCGFFLPVEESELVYTDRGDWCVGRL